MKRHKHHSISYITSTGKVLSQQQLIEIARGNIERHLGDVASDYDSEAAAADALYTEAYTLGFDALADLGVDHAAARTIADSIARNYAQQ